MRIVIDLTSLSYHITGIERYALCITEKMLNEDCINEYILIFRNEIYTTFQKFQNEKRIKMLILYGDRKILFLQVILPNALRNIKADKFLFFAFPNPILFYKKGIYSTFHDMGAWDAGFAMTFAQRTYFKFIYTISAKTSEGIITVSNFSKKRICEILKIKKEKVYVVNAALSDSLILKNENESVYENIKKKYNLPDKYIMSLSTLEPRKNLILLLDAFTKIMDKVDYDLVLVGRKGWKMNEVIKRYNDKSRIHLTGFVEDSDVSLIYKNTLCFVFPTLYEGFGMPPVEALALGAPVISSDAASMKEVLMEQAVYFKNGNMDELKDLLLNLENSISKMPKALNEYQRKNYDFKVSANKVLKILK